MNKAKAPEKPVLPFMRYSKKASHLKGILIIYKRNERNKELKIINQ